MKREYQTPHARAVSLGNREDVLVHESIPLGGEGTFDVRDELPEWGSLAPDDLRDVW